MLPLKRILAMMSYKSCHLVREGRRVFMIKSPGSNHVSLIGNTSCHTILFF